MLSKNHKLILALALSILGSSAQAAEQYFMRVPAPAKCAGTSCVMHSRAPDSPATPETPKPPAPRGTLTAVTSTDAGMQAIGGNGTGLQFTFTNTGTEPISNVYVTTSGSGFSAAVGPLRLTTCGVAGTRLVTIQPGATCKASVNFWPTDRGSRGGMVNIVTADSATPLASLALTGTGGTATPVVSVNSTVGLEFGTIAVGSSVTRTITYSNTGDAAYQLSGSGIYYPGSYTNAGYAVSRSCDNNFANGSYVFPGSTCTVSITITATSAGSTNAEYFDSTLPGGNIQIPLRFTAE